jgi:hypothetical protein
MGRVHYMQDRVQIATRIALLNRGLVENVSRGLVEDNPTEHPVERTTNNAWIPARLRLPAGDETSPENMQKVDLPIVYELVMYAWDENGQEVCPKQHDELILKYRRDGALVDTSSRLRITGTIQEVRKRNRLFSYVMPVVMDTEF